MADTEVSDLSAASTPAAADMLLLIQGGTSKRTTVDAVRTPDMVGQSYGFLAYLENPAYCTGNQGYSTSTTMAWKMWTPVDIAPSKIIWPLHTGGSSLSGWYTAFYTAADALIASTTSADISSVLQNSSPTASNIVSGGTAIAIPAGYFWLSLRCGTGTAPTMRQPNETATNRISPALTGTNAAAPVTAYRAATSAGTWSGGTAPSALGTLTADWRLPPIGLRA